MLVLLLALAASALAAPDGFSPFASRSFAASPGFAAPVNTFAPPAVQDTRSFATSGFAPQPVAAPVSSFAPPPTGFAAASPRFGAPVASVPNNRAFNLDSGVFAPQGGVAAAPSAFGRSQPDITVVERTEYLNDNGEFSSSYRGSDGQYFAETGKLHPTNDQLDQVVVKEGSYSYTSPEGVPVSVTYTADEYGFHPVSSSIPQPVAPLAPTF